MDPFDAIYCTVEDIVVVEDLEDWDRNTCPNCGQQGAVLVTVTEKVDNGDIPSL